MNSKSPISGSDRELGARIQKAREQLKVSKTDLGLAWGGSRQTVQHWEKGQHFPALSDFRRLCELLRTDANYLLGLQGMVVLTEQEAAKARLEIETAAKAAKNQQEEAAPVRPARGRLRQSTGNTGRFRRPA